MNITCLAIDDEYLALDLVSDYISKIPRLTLVKKCKSALEALEIMQKQKIDLLFLDIQMPDITGTEFIKTLHHKPVLILTTAYPEYALEGYELDVTDYLLKPIRFERFLKAVNKAISIIEMNCGIQQNNANPAKENRKPVKDYLFVKSGFKSVRVNFHDILYVEGLKEYVTIYTTAHKYTKLERMKNIEAELPKEMFIRIHKSFIVSIHKVDSIFGNTIEIGGKQLPVGRSYKQVVMEVFS